MQIEIPDHLVDGVEKRDVMLGLAVGLYTTGHFTLAQAADFASLSQAELQRELGRRGIPANYDLDDLAVDLNAAAELARQ